REILESAPVAVQAVKEAARRSQDIPFESRIFIARDVANRVLHTEDAKEGILAFREKRPPVWKGK
ncbi:MAG: enoyl-CoA hydratase-related protein, partial [Nitrospinota bacterium]|nr:enoyl-CoA hydratase-related protein [Nitrospinota bacterium]